MVLNLSIETFKWRLLILEIQHIKFVTAFKAVLSGITLGIFTPNRIGDIGGRLFFIEKGKRTYGLLATSIGSFAQFLTTIIMGIIGFFLFLLLFPEKTIINPIFNISSCILISLILIILIWIYFNIKRIKPLLLKLSFIKSMKTFDTKENRGYVLVKDN